MTRRSVLRVRFRALLLPLLAGTALWGLLIARGSARIGGQLYFVLADDEMVSMRYARNLVEGHRLVWNPGERAVEGYSNFLWTLWMAVLHLPGLPSSKVSLLVMITGVVALLATLVAVDALARRLGPDLRAARIVALWLTALCYPLAYWSLRGFEVGPAAFGVTALTLLALRYVDSPSDRDLAALAVTSALLALLRDDLLVFGLVALVFVVVSRPDRRGRAALVLGGTLALVVTAHIAFRLVYYGDALPNTYYLKITGVTLGTRIDRGFHALAGTWLLQLSVVLVLAGVGLAIRRRRRTAWFLAALILSSFAYSAYVGGDAWELFQFPNRYVAVVLPLLFPLAGMGVAALQSVRLTWSLVALLGGAAILAALLAARSFGLPLREQVDEAPFGPAPIWSHPHLLRGLLVAIAFAGIALGMVLMRRGAPAIGLFTVVAALVLGMNGEQAVERGGVARFYEANDATLARLGLDLRRLTAPRSRIAVTHAGSIPYFASGRLFVDLLGLNDHAVARSHPSRPFVPGHNKYHLSYSVGVLRPDIVVDVGAEDAALIARRYGYVRRFTRDPRAGQLLPGGGMLVRQSGY